MSTLKQHLGSVNKWRSQFNPLRSLTIQRAASLLEEGERGAYADLQWTYRMIEKRHPTLRALRARRLAAISKLDWSIKEVQSPESRVQSLAEAQADFLRAQYDKIDNLRAAIKFLALAEFRGFAHLERQTRTEDRSQKSEVRSPNRASETNHLEPVEQWFWCRDGLYAPWQYNADAASGRVAGAAVSADTLLIRETDTPLNEIALIQFVRAGLCNKDWDAFIEIYGLPRPAVIMPPNVPADKEAEYRDAAESIADGQSGALPSGADVKYPSETRGTQPFLERLKRLDEELVLAGTGGKLTMLSESGSGTLAGNAQADVFADLASAEALEISEVFQKQFDALLLAEKFPGQPALAYFELAATDKEDIGEIIEHAAKLSQAGYTLGVAELSERTGYRLVATDTHREDTDGVPRSVAAAALPNRSLWSRFKAIFNSAQPPYDAVALAALARAAGKDFAPLRARLEALAAITDDAERRAAAAQLKRDLAGYVGHDAATVAALEAAIGGALANGVTS
jgi:phage gp29-like protein